MTEEKSSGRLGGRAQKLMVCIDFGTYGFFAAYATPTQPELAKPVGDWPGMSDADYDKNLNAILVRKSDPTEVVAYGFEARDAYMESKEEKNHDDLMYFENFKLQLLQPEEFDTEKRILAIDGVNSMGLCNLVSMCLKNIVNHTIEFYKKYETLPIAFGEILWIVTVPAIWPMASREAMKQCCYAAGIGKENVLITSEPEAAGSYLIWGTEAGRDLVPGDSYMCLDIGAGTFDIVCHELGNERRLNDLFYADGGRHGAVDVDERFGQVLGRLLEEPGDTSEGRRVIQELKANHPVDFVEQLEEFQKARERIRVGDTKKNVPLAEGVHEFIDDRDINLADACRNYRIAEGDTSTVVSERRGMLIVQQRLWQHLHETVSNAITENVREKLALPQLEMIRRLFLVGGFSQNAFIQDNLTKLLAAQFPRIELIKIHKPELAVCMGGLWLAAKNTIDRRMLPCTYGICVEREWRRGDPPERRQVDPDYATYKLTNVFHILFEKEDEWVSGHFERFEYTVGAGIRVIELDFYKSDERYPSFVDEPGCLKQATFEYELLGDDVSPEPQTLMMRCELGEDSINMFVNLRDRHGKDKGMRPFTIKIGKKS